MEAISFHVASLKPVSTSIRQCMFTRAVVLFHQINVHLPGESMPPNDFEVWWRGVCSCKQALRLCLEQGCINTNIFWVKAAVETHSCGGCCRTEAIIVVQQFDLVVLTQRPAETGTVLGKNTFSSCMK